MTRLTHKLPSFSNVAAGSTATLELPLGLSYHLLNLEFSGLTLAQMKNIRVEVDGKTVQKWKDGNRLNSLTGHYQRGGATASILPIWFIRKELEELAQQRMFALGTLDVSTLHLLIDIDSAATNPQLKAYAVKGNQGPLGMITKIKTFPVSFATGGEVEIDNLPLPKTARIAAIHLYSNEVTHCELEMNGNKVFEQSKTMAGKLQTDYGRDPQTADKMTLDFMLEGDIAQALRLDNVQDFRLRPTLSAPGAVDVVVEYLDIFDGI